MPSSAFAPPTSVRVIGSSTLALCHLASGAADAYYQFGLHCWDLAAATVIIREAGGIVMDTSGKPQPSDPWSPGEGPQDRPATPQTSIPSPADRHPREGSGPGALFLPAQLCARIGGRAVTVPALWQSSKHLCPSPSKIHQDHRAGWVCPKVLEDGSERLPVPLPQSHCVQ